VHYKHDGKEEEEEEEKLEGVMTENKFLTEREGTGKLQVLLFSKYAAMLARPSGKGKLVTR
jgi:hypothetical protein